jgi:GMP synthase (glutamine-hydrolysing)
MREAIIILDYGSQYSQLIARRIREANVYCELYSWRTPAATILAHNPKGFLLSGGPNSVFESGAPTLPDYVLQSGVPMLGICYGMQLLAYRLGGEVATGRKHEYGSAILHVDDLESPLFKGWQQEGGDDACQVWMSHADKVELLPPGFVAQAHTNNSPLAASADPVRQIYAVQFHPEVVHTRQGRRILSNFAHHICGCGADWTPANFIDEQVAAIREQVGDGRVVLALSGGVDSAVAGALMHRAIGEQLSCIFVDHGMLRQGEALQVVETFDREMGMKLVAVNAVEEYLEALDGVTDPEQKRRIIDQDPP